MYITWLYDCTENVFDRSGIIEVEPESCLNDYDPYYELDDIYELTEEGEDLFLSWKWDYDAGYDLCYGRMQGLAAEYTQQQMWARLTEDRSLSTLADITEFINQ